MVSKYKNNKTLQKLEKWKIIKKTQTFTWLYSKKNYKNEMK